MRHGSRLLPVVLAAMAGTVGLSACGDRASGATHASSSTPGRSTPTPCPTPEQVGAAAGFAVSFTTGSGTGPDTWMGCQYRMTGRYRSNSITVTGEPASKADSVHDYMKDRVKDVNGPDAELERLDVGHGGWAFGGDSHGEAAAVAGSHVYHVEFGAVGLASMGDQKDAMVRVLKVLAH